MTVTWHDPCHLGRQGEPYVPWEGEEKKVLGQVLTWDPPKPRDNGAKGVYDQPRELLRAIPGVELVEMERIREYSWCCGAGGGCREAMPEYSAWTAGERITEAAATGAEALVTACGWCERNFMDSTSADRRADGGHGHPRARGARAGRTRRDTGRRVGRTGRRPGRGRPMTVPTAVLAELRGIVGARNFSDDPGILETYRYSLSHTAIHLGPWFDVYTPRGAAVVLPGSTEEVQEIVRLCNRDKVRFKASSTFWSAQGYPSYDDTVQIDMRRMDRILDIDERNLFAVVEPGVIGATLQAEAMKVGLNTHIPGVGCSASIVAGATSFFGSGPSNLYGGMAFDNLMAVEWVTPTGGLIRTASAGAGLGWFSGEGPGPSMRGVARGFLGSKGSMGVYTKCSVKLFPWPGPKTLPVTGDAPAYQVDLGPQFRSYTLAFPSWGAWADAAQLIWEAGIGYIAHRQFNMFGRDLKFAMVKILTDPDGTLEDLVPLLEDPDVQAATAQMQRDFQIVIVGQTMRDMEWQEAALAEILERTGGWKVEAMLDKAIHDWSLLYLVRLGHKNLNLVFGGSYDGAFGLLGPIDFGARRAEESAAFKLEWEKGGDIVAAGGDCFMGPIGGQGGGGSGLWENFTCFDSHDRGSTEGTLAFFEAVSAHMAQRGWGVGMEAWNLVARGPNGYAQPKAEQDRMHLGAPQPDAFRYTAAIRRALNPNDLGDAYYETLEDS